jgi:hypothetical protein
MNQIKCQNCNVINAPNMNFCTSCGSKIVLVAQSSIPTIENLAVGQQKFQQQNLPAKSKSSSKLWIFGLLGCFGLLGIGVIGVAFVVVVSQSDFGNKVSNNNQNANKSVLLANKNTNKIISLDNSKSVVEEETKTIKSDGNDLLDIFNDRKEVGKFKQLSANIVEVNDFFPVAQDAAQASYHNGSRYVAVSIGKFENFDDAKKNFNEQFANVKKKGGRTQILETAADGTINGVYQVKGIFTAEYCTKSAFCYRMASKDPKALKSFIEKFITL